MIVLNYATKKALKEEIGNPLQYLETSIHGTEYPLSGNGTLTGCNRPHITGHKREFFAKVTLQDHTIARVE